MMKRKIIAFALICALLLLTGCQLARPEAETAGEDRFCGFYVVPLQWDLNHEAMSFDFYDDPYLTAYGSDSLSVDGYGTFPIDRQVLFAVDDPDGHGLIFPGMPKGYSLFYYTYTDSHGTVSIVQSDMAPGEDGIQSKVTDEGEEWSCSGTIYFGCPENAPANWDELQEDAVWKAYRVWQTADGRVYIDASGNSYGGGGSMSFREEHSARSVNGKTVTTESASVKVNIEQVSRLENLTVYQYDAESRLLSASDIALNENMEPLTCRPGTAWVVVEEHRADGRVHTAYDLTEESIYHGLILLDEAGLGSYISLEITK